MKHSCPNARVPQPEQKAEVWNFVDGPAASMRFRLVRSRGELTRDDGCPTGKS